MRIGIVRILVFHVVWVVSEADSEAESCFYLDSSADNCSEIETSIPKTCDTDENINLPIKESQLEALKRPG